jgi:hypothetical protein
LAESLKVSVAAKEKVRLAAALLDVQQSKFVETAIDEAIERRAVDFAKGVKEAEKAMLGGKLEAAAFFSTKMSRNSGESREPSLGARGLQGGRLHTIRGTSWASLGVPPTLPRVPPA